MTITKSGALASFYTINKAPIKHLRIYFSPKQAGSGTASPENVREIEGWNSINFSYSQKGLAEFGSVGPYNYYFNGYNAQWIKTAQQVVPVTDRNQYYTYSCYIDNTNGTATSQVQVWFKDITNTKYLHVTPGNGIAVGAAGRSVVTFKPSSNDYYLGLGISLKDGAIASEGMLEIGNAMTEYEPYKGLLQTIDWSNDIGTIYGGYIDLVTGELVEEYIKRQVTEFTGVLGECKNGYCAYVYDAAYDHTVSKLNQSYMKCNYFEYSPYGRGAAGGTSNGMPLYTYGGDNGGLGTHGFILPSTITSLAEANAWLNNLSTPLECIIRLKNPNTYTLTPQQLETFLGRNNIWSNADRIEVEYDLAESNDELYRRRNILLQGAPHLETATGNVANFKTDLIAPIKEAKVYFEPKQLGSGDPSPSNMREIVGENSIKINQTGLNLIDLNQLSGSYSKTDLTCTIDNNTISLTANTNLSAFGQYTAIWYLPPALLGQEVYIGCTEVVHPEREYFSTVVCEFRDSNNVFISDPTVITTKTDVLGRKIQIPANAERVEFYFRIAQNGKTVGIPQGDTVVYKNFYVRWPAGTGGYEAYNGQTIPIMFPTVGKNLLDTSESNSEMTYLGWYYDVGLKLEAGTYTLSIENAFKNDYHGRGLLVNSEKNTILVIADTYSFGGSSDLNSRTFTITQEQAEQIAYFRVHFTKAGAVYSDVSESNLQIEKGSSATAYESYTNTIYGGYIDLLTGEIKCDWAKKKLTDFTWHNYTAKISYYTFLSAKYDGVSYRRINTGPIYSDTLKIYNDSAHLSRSPRELTYNNGYNLWIMLPEAMESDAANAWIAQNYPDASICFQIESPVTIGYINPIQLKTLKGTNNIWSSANGPVSIKYWTH